ncbi:2-dehydro-3-deoxygalactonokinase [Paracoccus sp. IB05]|uniref:2-dehydro-3-deoxygalactonokinase n=1 Tax=Paracoccus sp. IB05 TaxID=2779367 RepID=UPI0018E86FF7|nr:2-dehydro-3-deoxygalactonokinase [Paracoccus sp. IB05]MBJ2149534.1 2-dehydro-3-deoxygalactonokinase [Paracoccus sp. IB05]
MTALIAIDWGTTSFRAWALGPAGEVLAATEAGQGILAVPGADFDRAFETALAPWLGAGVPVIAAGMITSRNGWVETPYLPLPLDAAALAGALVEHRTQGGQQIHFVTGAVSDPEGDLPDVMRGEETEVIGQIAAGGGDGVYVLPGTHSKWVRVEEGQIRGLSTCMTGETFAVLRQHSILGRLIAPGVGSEAAFLRGVGAAKAPGALMARAFSARSLVLMGRLAPEEIADYLSGLLIGDEIRAGLQGLADGTRVTLIGRGDLAGRYARAFAAFGVTATVASEGMNRRGLFEIAKRGGLI